MRSFAIAFLVVFALGFASAVAFDRVGTAAGIAAVGASIAVILLMAVIGRAIAEGTGPSGNYLFNGPHYEVREGARYPDGFSDFFDALAEISLPESYLALAGGAWDKHIHEALSSAIMDRAELLLPVALTEEFKKARVLPISESQLAVLASLAQNHASPEIAMHLAAFTRDGPWLEWFDATDDPISMSLTIPETTVATFAKRIRGKWERHEGPEEKPLPSRKG